MYKNNELVTILSIKACPSFKIHRHTSLSRYSTSKPNLVNCILSQDDICKIACKLKETLRSKINNAFKSTIDHYKGKIFRLNSESEKLCDDLDALEQYGRYELMLFNVIPRLCRTVFVKNYKLVWSQTLHKPCEWCRLRSFVFQFHIARSNSNLTIHTHVFTESLIRMHQ